MNTRFTKRLLLIAAITASLVVVFVNWFVVDPLHIRILPTILRYTANLLLAILLGKCLFLALDGWKAWLGNLKAWRTTLGLLVLGVIFYLALPLWPVPSRFSATTIQVVVDRQPAQVVVTRILVGRQPIDLDACERSGDWKSYDGVQAAKPGSSGALTCRVFDPPGLSVKVDFQATQTPSTAEVRIASQVQKVDLTQPQAGLNVEAEQPLPASPAYRFNPAIRLVDGVFLLLAIIGAIQWDGHWSNQAIERQAGKLASSLNGWFIETTPRFQTMALVLGAAATLLTLFLFLQPALARKSPSPVRVKPGQTPPNIIFILADSLSANDMSLFGYSLPTTPHLEQITQTWSVYTNAQSAQTCTVLALPTFMTGHYPYTNDYAAYGDLVIRDPEWLSLPQTLQDAGYQTWWNGYFTPGYYHLGPGFDGSICRPGNSLHTGLIRSWFEPKGISKISFPFIPSILDQLNLVEYGREDFDLCEELDPLENLLTSQQTSSPFFMYYHYRGVHGLPYPPGNYLGAFLPIEEGMNSSVSQKKFAKQYDPERQPEVNQLRLRYAEAILDQDEKLEQLIHLLKQQGLYDSTMIVITADHGQSFSNGYTTHCTPLVSEAETHVPLLIKYPGQTQGQRIDDLVSTVDIAPTILDTAGFDIPKDRFDGVSLYQQAPGTVRNRITVTRSATFAVEPPNYLAATDGTYRLVKRYQEWFLFDILNDPLEKTNLIDQSAYANLPEVEKLRQAIENYRLESQRLEQGIPFLGVLR